jgi:site-specific recombinase XerD
VRRLLAATDDGLRGLRVRALVLVLWRSGLRISEALALKPADVERLPDGRVTLHVRRGKGGRERRVPLLGAEAAAVLGRWLDARERLGVGASAPVFCTIARPLPGGALDTSWARHLLRRLGARAGVEGARPHLFRHAFASERAHEGRPLAALGQALGHASLATTSAYVARLTPEALHDALGDVRLEESRRAAAAARFVWKRGDVEIEIV